jgi:hypothetical protein
MCGPTRGRAPNFVLRSTKNLWLGVLDIFIVRRFAVLFKLIFDSRSALHSMALRG